MGVACHVSIPGGGHVAGQRFCSQATCTKTTHSESGGSVPQKKRGDIPSEQNNIHYRLTKLENKEKEKITLLSFTALAIFNTFPVTLSDIFPM